jgi:hypothetical protein
MCLKQLLAQTKRIAETGVAQPTMYRAGGFRKRNFLRRIERLQPAQSPPRAYDVIPLQQQEVRKYAKAQESDTVFDAANLAFIFVQPQSQPFQKFFYFPFNFMQPVFIFTQQDGIVNVTQIERAAQNLFDEMIETVEIDISKKLAGQIANGQAFATRNRRE